ncbi:MAG TPA: ATP-binding cassette domain-containing protein, partial [Clostridia bacterium]|nr:ATP-binding cassette domain-containing protein [Clostridia bacterium]
MAVIELKNVKKTYEKGGVSYPIIKGVSLAVDEGEFVSIVGESGSGKSTLLYLMSGIERA